MTYVTMKKTLYWHVPCSNQSRRARSCRPGPRLVPRVTEPPKDRTLSRQNRDSKEPYDDEPNSCGSSNDSYGEPGTYNRLRHQEVRRARNSPANQQDQ